MRTRRPWPSAACRLVALASIAASAAISSAGATLPTKSPSAAAISERRSDLGDLRERIEQMKREVAAGESSRAEAADQLRDSERAISELQRELHELAEQQSMLRETMQSLASQAGVLAADLAAHESRRDRLLVRHYRAGSPDPLKLAMSGRDPNQIARDLHYLKIIATARSNLVRETAALLDRKRRFESEARAQADRLAEIEAQQRERQSRVARERDARRKLLARLSANIAAQRKEIGALQRNEQRLARLVERLARLAATTRKPRAATPVAPASAPPTAAARHGPPPENVDTPVAGLSGAFAKLRGSLRLPVAGTVTGRFGSAREGGSTWKGVFIRSPAGHAVKAIAPGHVVFADWMRGFGNLLIIDHGEAYLSIYGYNDALLRSLGDRVGSGDTIASVGNSGGHPESGLYFEIRHQGQPQDPLKWTGGR